LFADKYPEIFSIKPVGVHTHTHTSGRTMVSKVLTRELLRNSRTTDGLERKRIVATLAAIVAPRNGPAQYTLATD
jgi:hypothetical protein